MHIEYASGNLPNSIFLLLLNLLLLLDTKFETQQETRETEQDN